MYQKLNKPEDDQCVVIANPATVDYQVARTTLLVSLMKCLSKNKGAPQPIKMFEVSDVIVKNASIDVGAENLRMLGALYASNSTSGFEHIHGLLDRAMITLDIPFAKGYYLKENEDPSFFQGRRADVMLKTKDGELKIGVIGVLHPKVIANYNLAIPCSAFCINVEPFK